MGYETGRFLGTDFFNQEVRKSFFENTNANSNAAANWNNMGRSSPSSDSGRYSDVS